MEVENWKTYLQRRGWWNDEWERKFAVLSPDKLRRELQWLGDGSSGFGGNLLNQPVMERVREQVKKHQPVPDTNIGWIYQHHGSLFLQESSASPFLSALDHLVQLQSSLPEEVFQELWDAMELRAGQLREASEEI